MKLEKYNKKRNFLKTTEPEGKILNIEEKNRFVVQYHEARAKHYDFRLEYKGVLISWAIPKGFSYDTSQKRLAVKVEDHPLDYINFEGIIPKGNYGAGTVQIFDNGKYKPLWSLDYGLKKGRIRFILYGQKLKGEWSLIKTDDKNWLLMKHKDEFSVNETPQITNFKNPFTSCNLQLATLSQKIPKGKNWIFEIKYDGYRIVAFVDNKNVKLLTRNGKNYTEKFKSIVDDLKILSNKYSFVVDGEIVAFDENGRSDFELLHNRIKNGGKVKYVVFDILAFQGKDLRNEILKERKKYLERIITGENLVISSFVFGHGEQSFRLAKKLNLEGIVAKDINSTYNGTRDETWLKIKCKHRQEFVVVGYTFTKENPLLSALILAYYDNLNLVYVGKVGTGFNTEKRLELSKKLKKIAKNSEKIEKLPKFNDKNIIFVSPQIVVEIEFAELTKNKILRQPSFIAIRTDKNPQDVHLEETVEK